MRKLVAGLLAAALLVSSTNAATLPYKPEFQSGFRTLADLIPEVVGEPLEDEHSAPTGDTIQRTSTGLLTWRKIDNTATFTDGTTTWLRGPYGLQTRPANGAFLWEPTPRLPTLDGPTDTPSAAWSPGPSTDTLCPLRGSVEIPEADPFGNTHGDFSIEGWAIADCPDRAAFVDEVQVLVWGDMGSKSAVRLDQPGSAERLPRPVVAARLGEAYMLSGFRVAVDSSYIKTPAIVVFRVYVHVADSGWWHRNLVLHAEPRVPENPEAAKLTTSAMWRPFMEDRRLEEALAYAYHFCPDFRPYADRAAERGTHVRWEEMPQQVGGGYYPSSNVILLDKWVRYEPIQVAAALLAHEAFHAAKDGEAADKAGCLQEEIDAYNLEASVWKQLPKPANSTATTRLLDMLARALDGATLDRVVLESPYYQEKCGNPSAHNARLISASDP